MFGKTFGESANVEDAEKALGRKFDHFITRDFDLMNEVINQGVPLNQVEGSAQINKEIRNLMNDCRELLDSRAGASADESGARAALEKDE
jgi:hypothetical protein